MDLRTQRALAGITRRFYDVHAADFAATRDHAWPGWERLAQALLARGDVARPLRVLDVGCGNARLARFLRTRWPGELDYVGVDASEPLLARARTAEPRGAFHRSDVVLDGWPAAADPGRGFDLVAAFGLLHHVPGRERRARLARELAARVRASGWLAVSFWRFGEHERFARRSVGWARTPWICEAELEPGDVLLGWRDGDGVRYCHAWDTDEIEALLATLRDCGLTVRLDFDADGREGDLNRHVVLAREAAVAESAEA